MQKSDPESKDHREMEGKVVLGPGAMDFGTFLFKNRTVII